MSGERVVVAMSGGVDSSVAAARLVDQGFDVVGVTLHLWDYPDDGSVRGRCCAPEDQHDARRVADHLGIPHFTFDRRELFPLARRLGAAKVATGHYARVVESDGVARLHRAKDPEKDQSYFLHMLRADELAKVAFPLGESSKAEVRAEAIARRLPGAEKGESQEICFVPTGRYDAFVAERAEGRIRPGPVVDPEGRPVGTHQGIHGFTIGQRKGLGVALGRPVFVVGLDASTGTVKLGDEAALSSSEARFEGAEWSDDVSFPLEAEVRVRARHVGERATIDREGEGFVARFHAPVRAISPGQVAVAYRGDRVLGGGTITSSGAP